MANDVANLGLIRPPLVYGVAILLGVLLRLAMPMPLVPWSVITLAGIGVTLLAAGLFVWAVRTMRAANTPVPGNVPTTTIVRSGPFGFSRNPIYLAFTLLHFGLALWLNSTAVMLTLLPAVALIWFVVIPKEERYLEARFPAEYPPYKAAVRRWL